MKNHNNERARAQSSEDHELELALDRKLSRYSPSASEDLQKLDAEDWRTIRTVLEYLQSNRRTGAWLPLRRRLAILEELESFPALQIGFACVSFLDGRCIETKKPLRYFLGICRDSAFRKYSELQSERHRNGRFKLERPS